MLPDTTLRCHKSTVSTRHKATPPRTRRWPTLCLWVLVLALFVVALLMRLYTLDVGFDRDSYDEGVYWQSLRAMSSGESLYRDIFYSQPPLFLPSIYPIYLLFGQTLWAARLGIALISLCGFVGIALLGRTLAGHLGMLMALLLLLADPLYLRESQTLQADAPSIALSLLAVGLAYCWWNKPTGLRGLLLSIATAIILALSILSKLLVVTAVVPIGLLALARLWLIWRRPAPLHTRLNATLPLLAGGLAFLLTCLLFILPFSDTFGAVWSSVVTFHTDAKVSFTDTLDRNLPALQSTFVTLLGFTACYGTISALLRHDWRVIPLLGWLLTTVMLIWQQVPLFPHHLVALMPPLMILAVMGIHPAHTPRSVFPRKLFWSLHEIRHPNCATSIMLALLWCTLFFSFNDVRHYYDSIQARATSPISLHEHMIIQDLQRHILPDETLLTDAPFLAAAAGYTIPASLVDMSEVRVRSGYISSEQLMRDASRPEIQAVLIYGPTRIYRMTDFYRWLINHYSLIAVYNPYEELWVKAT